MPGPPERRPLDSGGVDYLVAGFRLLRERDVLPFFLLPLTVNVLVFGGLIWWSVGAFAEWQAYALGLVPEWLGWLEWLLWPLFILFIVLVVFYGFALVANVIASPFNGLLAERVAARLRPPKRPETVGLTAFLATIPGAVLRELRKLLYFAALAILILLAMFTPLSPLAPLLWFLFSAWTLALEYCDFQADNDGVGFRQLRGRVARRRGLALSFGAATYAATLVPILNLVVMPAAVCGATLMWIENYDD